MATKFLDTPANRRDANEFGRRPLVDKPPRIYMGDPKPGYYEGRGEHEGKIYEVRNTKDGLRWYALHIHRVGKAMRFTYVGHSCLLGERIEL